MSLSRSVIDAFLRKVHAGFDTMSAIEQGIWREVLAAVNEATVSGLLKSSTPTFSEAFLSALRHSNEVFAAFKVHTLQQEVAAKLLTPDGKLKSFADFRRDVEGITSHQCGAWLRTEYDTAVIRAHNAADWQQFEANRDVMPNLRWLPTTAPDPEQNHRAFWTVRLNLPVSDPFWQQHHPGDHWNCKCSLEQNDDPVVRPSDIPSYTAPDRGLENNPGTDAHTFSDKHPYFPSSCSHCFAYKSGKPKNRLAAVFRNARAKDCYNCPYIDGCISRQTSDGFKLEHNFKNGGKLYLHPGIEKDKADYNDMKQICTQFAKLGHEVRMTPRLHCKSEEYRQIYASLIGTKYENKCPDFSVDGIFYEYEGFVKPWNKKKVGRMLSHGLQQSSRVVINNTKGCSDRFLRKAVMARIHLPGQEVNEVWIYEKGNLRLFYKDRKFHYN